MRPDEHSSIADKVRAYVRANPTGAFLVGLTSSLASALAALLLNRAGFDYFAFFVLGVGALILYCLFVLLRLREIDIDVKYLRLTTKTETARETAISLTYFDHLRKKHYTVKATLLACGSVLVALSLPWSKTRLMFEDWNLGGLGTIAIAFLGLIILKEAMVEYRIRHGLFGTNRSEARDLINFIIENSDDIDFTDSNGKLRRALLPEASHTSKSPRGPAQADAIA